MSVGDAPDTGEIPPTLPDRATAVSGSAPTRSVQLLRVASPNQEEEAPRGGNTGSHPPGQSGGTQRVGESGDGVPSLQPLEGKHAAALFLTGAKEPPRPSPVKCSMHNTVEGGVYPYRCSACGGCYLCQHKLRRYEFWECFNGKLRPTHLDPGVPVTKRALW